MSRIRLTAFAGSLVATTIVLTLVVGPTFSAIPNPANKKFYACMNKRTRVIKMLNYPKVSKCPARHRLIKWNAKGNPGAPGAPGAAGAAGPADWNAIPNKPPGFADGADDAGYVSAVQPGNYTVTTSTSFFVDTRIGTDVEVTLIPADPNEAVRIAEETWMRKDAGTLRKFYFLDCVNGCPVTFKVRTRVYNAGIAPAALKKAAKRIKVGVTKRGPGAKTGKKKRR